MGNEADTVFKHAFPLLVVAAPISVAASSDDRVVFVGFGVLRARSPFFVVAAPSELEQQGGPARADGRGGVHLWDQTLRQLLSRVRGGGSILVPYVLQLFFLSIINFSSLLLSIY